MKKDNDIMLSEHNELVEKLNDLQKNQTYYSVDTMGLPAAITLENKGIQFILSRAFPENKFENIPVSLGKENEREPETNQVFKMVGDKKIKLGYITDTQLKSYAGHLFEAPAMNTLTVNDTLALGIGYSPKPVRDIISGNTIDNAFLAKDYFIKIMSLPNDGNSMNLKKIALLPLIQHDLMSNLTIAEYDQVIKVLENKNYRVQPDPWRLYSLSQVYLSRHAATSEPNDWCTYKKYLLAFKEDFRSRGWDTLKVKNDDTGKMVYKYAVEREWYETSPGNKYACN